MTMYELTGQWLELMAMAEDEEIDPEILADTIEQVDGDLEAKAENYAKVLRMLDGEAKAIDEEAKRLTARAKVIKNNCDRLKRSLEGMMIATGKRKFKTKLFSFGIQKNPARLVLDDAEAIPAEYWVPQEPKLDNAAVKAAIEQGIEISGAHLEQGESLRIR